MSNRKLPDGERLLAVDGREFGLIVRGLRSIRMEFRRGLRKNKAEGFVPEPGKININEARLKTLAGLMDRLGID